MVSTEAKEKNEMTEEVAQNGYTIESVVFAKKNVGVPS